MGLQSLQYCAFLVVVAAVYLHLPVRMQSVFLLGASWVFYALAMPAMLPVTLHWRCSPTCAAAALPGGAAHTKPPFCALA